MKKILSLALSLVIMLSFALNINFSAYAASNGTCGDSLYWSLSDSGVFTVSGSGRMYDYYDNSLPPWYNERANIKTVVIDDGIPNIGSRAFKDCVNLESVDWGTIDTIGDHAFMGCTSLKHAFLPGSCTWLWNNAFENCTSLQSAYIGAVNSYSNTIPDGFFKGCTSLGVIGLGTGINDMGMECIASCPLRAIITDTADLETGDIPKIGWSYLSGNCYQSTNAYPNGNLQWHFNLEDCRLWFTGYGDMADYDNNTHTQPWYKFMTGVNTIDFSTTSGMTSVSTTAFQGGSSVEHVDFTNVYAIGWGAFAECDSLGTVTFDSCLTQIWNYAFANDTSIVNVNFTQGNNNLHIYPWAFNNCSGTTYWISLPSNVTNIDDHAFWGTNFNYNTIENPSCYIGDDAFGDGTGGYARFFSTGSTATTACTWVRNNRNNNDYNWWYYCKDDNHTYATTTVAPTCTEQGYDSYGCQYCDAEPQKSNYVAALGHDFRFTGNTSLTLHYNCNRCGLTNLSYSAVDTVNGFVLSSTAGNTKFHQSDYDGRADLDINGVVNAKDFVLLRDILASPDLTGKETTFNTSVTYQTIDGFGASAAWWAQDVGQWSNAEDILKLLYSEDEGIGLNIYRYNLGAGSEDQQDYNLYVSGARTHCFMQSNGTYNWNNDPGAMNALSIANDLNPNLRVTLFSNSAPYFMTKSGKTYGALTDNGDGTYSRTENLDSSKFSDFATFVANCADHFIDEGYNVTSVSPINEPEWDWSGWMNGDGTQSCNQEGCHFDEGTARLFYNNYMVPTLRSRSSLNGKVELEVWESGQMNHNWWWTRFLNQCFSKNGSYSGNNSNIRSYVDTIATHSYWAGQDAREAVAAQVSGSDYGQAFRCTEFCQMTGDTTSGVLGHIQAEGGNTNGMDIDYGLALADTMYQDLTIINAKEWDWWTACSRGIYPDALVYINDTNHDHIETSKRLWCMGNYSKFIKEGAKRISVSTGASFASDLHTDPENVYTWSTDWETGTDKYNYLDVSAYQNPNGDIVIVYVNNSDTIEYTTFTDDSLYSGFTTYVTDATRNLQQVQQGKIGDPVCIPARSVTTAVIKYYGAPAESQSGAYLFTYFTGNSQSEQTIHFAVSKDGYNYTPLNGNNAVISQTKGRLCCRDPYIFKGQDNYYYIIATDMDASNNEWWGNSNSIILWRSSDLVTWTDETVIDMAQITNSWLGRCWAPQVIWDEDEEMYMVYFGMWTDRDNRGTVLYYSYTDDLLDQSSYSDPQPLYVPTSGKDAIDGDIIYDSESDTYYLYYKDESNATICWVKSDNLTGPYVDASAPEKLLDSDVGLEGCNAFFITGTDTLVMLADAYGDGFFVMYQSTDFENFYPVLNSAFTINNCQPRHGSVIPISNQEYKRLTTYIGF